MIKIVVEVYFPVAGKAYDVFIPFKSKMSEVLMLLCRVAPELSDGVFKASKDTVLCDRSDGVILNLNMTVEELGIRNGTKLILL